MDRFSARVANRLVGNDDGAAVLEMTLKGPTIEFEDDALIALSGADLSPRVADVSIPGWRALLVKAGTTLTFGPARWGCRAYLAVAGGIDVPEVMGSRSTHLRAGFGGYEGRALRGGDDLQRGAPSELAEEIAAGAPRDTGQRTFALTQKRIGAQSIRSIFDRSTVRYTTGCEARLFGAATRAAFDETTFTVSPASDRMGFRLTGRALEIDDEQELPSRGVAFGSVQVPRGGEPILLMADHQTTGGYPVIADVIAADLPLVAQRKPGDKLRFQRVDVGEAQRVLREAETLLDEMTERAHADG